MPRSAICWAGRQLCVVLLSRQAVSGWLCPWTFIATNTETDSAPQLPELSLPFMSARVTAFGRLADVLCFPDPLSGAHLPSAPLHFCFPLSAGTVCFYTGALWDFVVCEYFLRPVAHLSGGLWRAYIFHFDEVQFTHFSFYPVFGIKSVHPLSIPSSWISSTICFYEVLHFYVLPWSLWPMLTQSLYEVKPKVMVFVWFYLWCLTPQATCWKAVFPPQSRLSTLVRNQWACCLILSSPPSSVLQPTPPVLMTVAE